MGIASTVFIELVITALSYSAVKLGFVSLKFAISNTVILWLFSGPFVYFGAYRAALANVRLAARSKSSTP